MADSELVCIYVSGGDSPLRTACFDLIARKLITDVDLLSHAPLFIRPDGKQKVGASSRCVMIVTRREHVAAVFAGLGGAGDDVRGYALPVLDSFGA